MSEFWRFDWRLQACTADTRRPHAGAAADSAAPLRSFGAAWWLLLWLLTPQLAAGPLDPPDAAAVAEARALVSAMKANPRGPYARIRWFCNDGSVLPPSANACDGHGGGRQHGEFSPARERLAELGYHVGTVFLALSWDEFFDAAQRHDRMRELSLERYLQSVDDGWVLRRARHYRGRVQVEGETRVGRALLARLLGDDAWVRANYLLALETVRSVPHGDGGDLMRSVRRGSQDLADRAPSSEPLRVVVHTAPQPDTADAYRRWADSAETAELAAAGIQLADQLDALFGPTGRRQRIESRRAGLARIAPQVAAGLPELPAPGGDFDPDSAAQVAGTMAALRDLLTARQLGPTRLALFDLLVELEAELVVAMTQADSQAQTRSNLLDVARTLVDATYGVGLLSPGERDSIHTLGNHVQQAATLDNYRLLVQQLGRLPQWATGSVRFTFLESLVRYTALDPAAGRFVDDLLRSSPLFPLGRVTRRLNQDLHQLAGTGVQMLDTRPAGVVGLNPGYASGPLRVYPTLEVLAASAPERGDIVVLPETTSELAPVAGIITLGEGNPLSHVQLLARNFGIPNVAIGSDVLATLEAHAGEQVTLAVATDGSVVLLPAAAALHQAGNLLQATQPDRSERLTVPLPDLTQRRPLPIAELQRSLSGRVVGPKAANLGELNRLFPGRVAPAIALPFGIFADHTQALRAQLTAAYAAYADGSLDADGLADALAEARATIAASRVSDSMRAELTPLMANLFGAAGSYGVFLRSDTNVEDLPQFTGAGLSETVANVVGLEAQLDTVPRVWASVLSPRAIAWRSNLMTNPEHVYASVLLMRSVPSTKSGVLITANLVHAQTPAITAATAWGVGGAVAGEAAATLVLLPPGAGPDELLVSEAKAAYQRQLDPAGGMQLVPAESGPVLTAAEKQALRELAAEVGSKYAPVLNDDGQPRPWDIEYGFVDGELTLFQIRPLVERGARRADRIVARLLGDSGSSTRPTGTSAVALEALLP